MGCCCSSDEEDDERQSLVISSPQHVSSSNPLATQPIPVEESPIKSSTGGTPPPGPRLPPRRIRSTGPAPHGTSINDVVPAVSSSPPPPPSAFVSPSAAPAEAETRSVPPVAQQPAVPTVASPKQPQLSPRPGAEARQAAKADKKLEPQPLVETKKDSDKKAKKEKKPKKEKKDKTKPSEKKEKKGLFSRMFSSTDDKASSASSDLVIGGPTGFRRDQHIGWDPERGFDLQNLPQQWQTLFTKAGVTESELKNKETALFIINVVAASLGSASFRPAASSYSLTGSQPALALSQQTAPSAPPMAAPINAPKTEAPQSGDASSFSPRTSDSVPASHSSYTSLSQLSLEPSSESSISSATQSEASAHLPPPAVPPRSLEEERAHTAAPPPPPRRSDVVAPAATSFAPAPPAPPAAPLSSPKAPPAPPAKQSSKASIDSAQSRPPPPPSRTDTEDLLAAIRAKGSGGLRKVEAPPDLKKLTAKEEDSLASILSRAMEARRAYLREDKEENDDDKGWD